MNGSFGMGRAFAMASLLVAVVLTIVALSTQWHELIFAAVALAVIPLLVVMIRGGGDRPSDADVRWFVEGAMRSRLGRDAFTVRSLRPGMLSVLYGRRGFMPFRAQIVLTQSLYQKASIPWDKLGGLTERRIEAVSRQLDGLVESLGDEALELKAEMPADPFAVTYIAEKAARGRRYVISGAVTFVPSGTSWALSLEHLSWGRKTIEILGQPAAAFPDAIALGTWGGEKWLMENVAAWKAFFRKLATLQDQIDNVGADQGERAVRGFFRSVKAGTVFEGVGRSLSEQHEPTRFFLEVRSVDAASGGIAFLLRNERGWENARRFSGTVAFDAGEKAVWLHGHTERRDAFQNAGPLIGAQTAFSLDFHFRTGSPRSLTSSGGDVSMTLEEISRAGLRELRDSIFGRRRRVTDVLRPGVGFAGQFTSAAESGLLSLSLLEGPAGARDLEVKLEAADWSGIFHVIELAGTETTAAEAGGKLAFALEPVMRREGAKAETDGESRWRVVTLTASEDGGLLEGVAEGAHGPCDIVLRRGVPASARNGANPADPAVKVSTASPA